MRGSSPMPRMTSDASVPYSSAIVAISLVNDSLSARNAFEPFLMSSAAATSTTRIGASSRSYRSVTRDTAAGSASSNRPTTIRVGWRKSSSAVPWRRNSGLVSRWLVVLPAHATAARVDPGGNVLRITIGVPAAASGSRAASAPRSCDRSLRPSSPIGVPTQTRTASARPVGRSVSRRDPAARAAASELGRPDSWMGARPACRMVRRSGSASTSSTVWPSSTRPTAVMSPT